MGIFGIGIMKFFVGSSMGTIALASSQYFPDRGDKATCKANVDVWTTSSNCWI